MIVPLIVTALGLTLLVTAVATVVSRNLVHSVFWLAATLIATAGAYVVLGASFLAGVQIILYTGGVVTLMLFGVMLTRHNPDTNVPSPVQGHFRAGLVACIVLFAMLVGIWGTPELGMASPRASGTAAEIGSAIVGPHLLAFEALSVLLLASMIGAIVLARRQDP